METLSKFIGTLCIVIFIIGIISNFIPVLHTEKSIKTVFTIYTIYFLLYLFNNADFDIIPENIFEINEIELQSENYIINEAGKNIEYNIEDILLKNNISYTDVKLHINIEIDGAYISMIEIHGTDSIQHTQIYKLLSHIAEKEIIILGD